MSWIIGGIVVLFIIGLLVRADEEEEEIEPSKQQLKQPLHPLSQMPSTPKTTNKTQSILQKTAHNIETVGIGLNTTLENVNAGLDYISNSLKTIQNVREYTRDLSIAVKVEEKLLEYHLESSSFELSKRQSPELRKLFEQHNLLSNNESSTQSTSTHKIPSFIIPQGALKLEYYEDIKERYEDLAQDRIYAITDIDNQLKNNKQLRTVFIETLTDNNLEYLRPIFERPSGKKISDFSQFFEVIEP